MSHRKLCFYLRCCPIIYRARYLCERQYLKAHVNTKDVARRADFHTDAKSENRQLEPCAKSPVEVPTNQNTILHSGTISKHANTSTQCLLGEHGPLKNTQQCLDRKILSELLRTEILVNSTI